jgi:hypothetical protein
MPVCISASNGDVVWESERWSSEYIRCIRGGSSTEIHPEHGIIVQVVGWYDDDGKLALAVICKIEIAWSGEIATIKIIHILNELNVKDVTIAKRSRSLTN